MNANDSYWTSGSDVRIPEYDDPILSPEERKSLLSRPPERRSDMVGRAMFAYASMLATQNQETYTREKFKDLRTYNKNVFDMLRERIKAVLEEVGSEHAHD